MSKAKEAFPKARRGEDREGPRQTGPKTKRDVSGVVVGVPANGWTPQKIHAARPEEDKTRTLEEKSQSEKQVSTCERSPTSCSAWT